MTVRPALAVAAVLAFAAPVRAQAPAPAPAPQTAEAERETIRTALRAVQRIVSEHGIEQERYLTLGGVRQWINLRGQDRRAPILLFLHGGPGDPISGLAYTYQRPWEDFFTVVNWDQRGFGRSAGRPEDTARLKGTLTVEQDVADGVELIERLRKELGQRKVVLVGQSYGTVLALKIAKSRPDLLHAVVLQGLAVNWLKSADMVRDFLIQEAEARGDKAEADRLRAVGPIPNARDADAVLAWGPRMGKPIPDAHTWHNMKGQGDGWAFREETLKSVSPDLTPDAFAAQKSAFADHPDRFKAAMLSVLPFDAYRDVGVRFKVPFIVMQGAFDWQTNRDVAKAYFDKVCAPWKKWDEFPQAAHALNVEQPGLSVVALVNDVLPAVKGRKPAGAKVCEPVR